MHLIRLMRMGLEVLQSSELRVGDGFPPRTRVLSSARHQ